MEERQLESVERLFEPLRDELGGAVHSIILYGSAVRKTRVEGSDIDVLVLLDDTRPGFGAEDYRLAKEMVQAISAGADDDFELHLQPPRLLSHWWQLLLQGEPWAITAMRYSQAIYDPSGFLPTVRALVETEETKNKQYRARKLADRSRETLDEGRGLLQEDILEHLLEAMVDAAQAPLMFDAAPPLSPAQTTAALEDRYGDSELLAGGTVQVFRDAVAIRNELDAGERDMISGEELDDLMTGAMEFIEVMEELFNRELTAQKEQVLRQSHDRMMELCRQAVEEKEPEAEETLEAFRELFIDPGLMSEEYWGLVQDIDRYRTDLEESGVGHLDTDTVYGLSAKLQDFEAALDSAMDNGLRRDPLLEEEGWESEEPVEPVKTFTDRLLQERDDEVAAVWLLTIKELLETEDATVIVLADDVERDVDVEAVEDGAEAVADEVAEQYGFRIHVTVYRLSDYWNVLHTGSPSIHAEIRLGIPVYDPRRLFAPVKRLVREGRVPGTIESMRERLREAPQRVARPCSEVKARVLEKMYLAVVEASQALLLSADVPPPVQRKVPERLEENALEADLISEEYVDHSRDVIRLWKDYEHDAVKTIDGGQLDDAIESAEYVVQKSADIVERG